MASRTIKSMVCALALGVCACGGVGTYNLFAAPEHRLGGHRYDGVSLLGPTLIGIAVQLFILPRLVAGAPLREGRIRLSRRLKILGGVMSVAPAALGIAQAVLFHGEGAYLLFFALILFTGPGLCFFVFGAVAEAIAKRHRQNGTCDMKEAP